MAITPPDPGHAIDLAKACTFDAASGGFRQGEQVRWLYPEGGTVWTPTARAERTVDARTFELLKAADPDARRNASFRSSGAWWVLLDDGFTAMARPA